MTKLNILLLSVFIFSGQFAEAGCMPCGPRGNRVCCNEEACRRCEEEDANQKPAVSSFECSFPAQGGDFFEFSNEGSELKIQGR